MSEIRILAIDDDKACRDFLGEIPGNTDCFFIACKWLNLSAQPVGPGHSRGTHV